MIAAVFTQETSRPLVKHSMSMTVPLNTAHALISTLIRILSLVKSLMFDCPKKRHRVQKYCKSVMITWVKILSSLFA